MSSLKSQTVIVNVDIGDQLTTISCGHIVAEFVRFIAYQRLQIPYSYQWLKQIVNKKKISEEDNRTESLQSERHYRVASTALENLDFILKSLLQEINSATVPEEVCIMLGGCPITCKEVYRLLLPTSCHKPNCHSQDIASDQKIQRNVFRELVTSEKLSKILFNPIPPTNTYVFIKKKAINQDIVLNHDNFIFTSGHRIPRSSKIVVIDFRGSSKRTVSCCNHFQIFGETINDKLDNLKIDDSADVDYNEIESTDSDKWYQSTYVMKGFKDCSINGTSVTSSWLES